MGAADEFVEDNFIRATRHLTRARILASRLGPILQQRYPELFSSCPTVTAVRHQGWTNFTMSVRGGEGDQSYILRLRARTNPHEVSSRSVPQFEKERYVLERLQGVSLVPQIPAEGSGSLVIDISKNDRSEFGYILQSELPHVAADRDIGREDRAQCFRQLGEALRVVHSVTVEGFGTEFDEARGAFALERWGDVIARRIIEIEKSGVDANLKRFVVARLRRLESVDAHPTLYHQDLLSNWGNFLVDENRLVRGIIDWEFCGSGLAFHQEIASFIYAQTRDGVEPELINRDLHSFFEGYGITMPEYQQHYEHEVETFVLLYAVTALEKFVTLRKNGGLEREPWRATFAERARHLCERGMTGVAARARVS